jgi:hypothetical protein
MTKPIKAVSSAVGTEDYVIKNFIVPLARRSSRRTPTFANDGTA